MSRIAFDDDCPDCRPVILSPTTGHPFRADSPAVQALNRVWENTTRAEREAFHRFTCLNSRDPEVLAVVHALVLRLQLACKEPDPQ